MEEIVSLPFKRVERSYCCTTGWRLATFEEAKNGLEMIKAEKNLLQNWDRVRLLDGWITGPGYNFEMGNDFKGCLGYMLLIQTEASGCAYADVEISDSQKQVALLLCTDDWNYEVVYWLFNSWAKKDSYMDLEDVMQGRIPFSDPEKFIEMNKVICSVAGKLGDKGPVSLKAKKRAISEADSVEDVLDDMIKLVDKEYLQQYSFHDFFDLDEFEESCLPWPLEPDWLEGITEQEGEDWNYIADAIWNFLSESYAGSMVEIMATLMLGYICKKSDMETKTPKQKNFIVASCILLCLSEERTDIIHAQLEHDCFQSCASEMICHVASKHGRADLPGFNQALKNNAMWRCYDPIGNYDVLNKLLVLAAAGYSSSWLETEKRIDLLMVESLLECGARPISAYPFLGYEKLTALDAALRYVDDDGILKEIAQSFLKSCDNEQEKQLMLNTPNENGCTALHLATLLGKENICEILLDCGAQLDVPNEDGMTALHIAVKVGKDTIIDLFMKDQGRIGNLVDFRDKIQQSPIDTAAARRDMRLVAKLIANSEEPSDYFEKLDLTQLLHYSLLNGSFRVVRDLLKRKAKLSAGECDDEGKTALHLAAMCEDNHKAMDMVKLVLENAAEKEKLVARTDRRRRTALQEAALNGNEKLCTYLLEINPKIINFKDGDGRNPIYDAAKGKQNEENVMKKLLSVYYKNDIPLNALIDRNGLTPLHVAASLGRRELVKLLLSNEKKGKEYVKRRDVAAQETLEYLKMSDLLGQTALHKAANCGNAETVELLLRKGAHPLEERDCDGRTALHYVVKSKNEGDKKKLIDLLLQPGCKTNEERWLLLWASAAGLGTAHECLNSDDPLCQFLSKKRDKIKAQLHTSNLLKTAASEGDIEMTKELITRGYQMGDIKKWIDGLEIPKDKTDNVQKVSRHLQRIVEQGNDQPTVVDNLGRIDYAYGLAALLLNPYIKPPIVVGISGSWGMGKSSLMVQTESILLKTAAQMALLQSAKISSSALGLPELTTPQLSKKGEHKYEQLKRHVDLAQKDNRTLFSIVMDKIWCCAKKNNEKVSRNKNGHDELDSLEVFLSDYQAKHRKVFKSLAAMDSSDMFTTTTKEDKELQNPQPKSAWTTVKDIVKDMFTINNQQSKSSLPSTLESPVEESIPAVLTVQYNAWKYRNEREALAGLAVEITKELEGIMTDAQLLSTCWRNTWQKKKYNICIEIIYPCLLAVVLACAITWILWAILDRSDKFKDWAIAKYGCLPTAIVVVVWIVTKSVMGVLKPVSSQLMNYLSFPDHADKLGYQERVISDISFLKEEIGKRPCMIFKAYSWILAMISAMWILVAPLFFYFNFFGERMMLPKIPPALGLNLRIIVFIDDLDRCQESVILQVLSAINLVLAVCEINVVLGIDKEMIEKAIIRKHGDMKTNRPFKDNQELADKYLQKIIQLPLDLPDPSEEQSRKFLEGQLGIFQEDPSEGTDSVQKPSTAKAKLVTQKTLRPEAGRSSDVMEGQAVSETVPEVTIDMGIKGKEYQTEATRSDAVAALSDQREAQQERDVPTSNTTVSEHFTEREIRQGRVLIGNRYHLSFIPIRELLFVRYSKGEQDAFRYFQKLVTDCRKLPREWKRHLTYHRLVWNILYLTREAKDLAGWQVQLITWIFVCWEWRENMNCIIQNWKKIEIPESSPSNGPSLQMIVDYFTERERKNLMMIETFHDVQETKKTVHKTSVSRETNIETEKSGNWKQKKSVEANKHDMVINDITPPQFQGQNKKKGNKKEKRKNRKEARETSLERNIADQESSIRACQAKMESTVIKQVGLLEKTLRKELDELKREINDLKDEFMKQQSRRNEKKLEETKEKLERWETLRSVLDKYDVPMNAIQVFQRFRFYCRAGHLPWPINEQIMRIKSTENYED